MKKFDYFKWEKEKNIEQLRKMSGAQSFKAGLSLLEMALKMLKASLTKEHPKMSQKSLHKEMRTFLWRTQ